MLAALAQPVYAEWHTESQAIMGTRVKVEFFLEDKALAQRLLTDVMGEMHRIDHAFSSYKEDSELSRLNREAPRGWVSVSDEMMDLLTKAEMSTRQPSEGRRACPEALAAVFTDRDSRHCLDLPTLLLSTA